MQINVSEALIAIIDLSDSIRQANSSRDGLRERRLAVRDIPYN